MIFGPDIKHDGRCKTSVNPGTVQFSTKTFGSPASCSAKVGIKMWPDFEEVMVFVFVTKIRTVWHTLLTRSKGNFFSMFYLNQLGLVEEKYR